MLLFLNIPDKPLVKLLLPDDPNLSDLAEQVQRRTGVDVESQRLIFRQRMLLGDSPLREYGISDGCTVRLDTAKPTIHVFVKNLNGHTDMYTIDPSSSVLSLKQKIEANQSVAYDQQRLIFNGRQMDDDQQLSYYGVEPCSTLHLVLRLRGMISTFTSSDDTDPVVRYLMNDGKGQAPMEDILSRFGSESPPLLSDAFLYKHRCEYLAEPHLRLLCLFLNYYGSAAGMSGKADIKLVVPAALMEQLLATQDEEMQDPMFKSASVCANLLSLFRPSLGNRPMLALRLTRGPSMGCINFHYDGCYATHTTQIVLNSKQEYKGGRLCFLTRTGLVYPRRVAGSMTQHGTNVLHAVTALKEGTRKSLFVLDDKNGMGATDVFHLNQQDVDEFIARMRVFGTKRQRV